MPLIIPSSFEQQPQAEMRLGESGLTLDQGPVGNRGGRVVALPLSRLVERGGEFLADAPGKSAERSGS